MKLLTHWLFALLFCAWLFMCHNYIKPELNGIAVWLIGCIGFVYCYARGDNTK